MIWVKILLLLVLTVLPMVPVVLALPWISTAAVVVLLGFWMLDPSWGPWVYGGICLNLLQWRTRQIHVDKLKMSVYVSSPSMAIQNGTSVEAAIGAAIGAIRSFVAGDISGTALGVIVAGLLFGLQGILFPNPSVITQVCGDPFVAPDELSRLLERADYPTLLKFNRHARKRALSRTMLAVELANVLDRNQSSR